MPFIKYDPTSPEGKPNIAGLYQVEPANRGRNVIKVTNEVFDRVKDFPRCYAVNGDNVVQVRDPEAIFEEGSRKAAFSQKLRGYEAESTNNIEFDGQTLLVDNSLLFRINLNLTLYKESNLNVLAITGTELKEIILDSKQVLKLSKVLAERHSKVVTKYGKM